MKNIGSKLLVILFVGVGALVLGSLRFSDNKSNQIAKADEIKTEVKWYTIEEAAALSKKKPRKIFVDVYTEWCGWCKQMDKTTFANHKIAQYLNDNFYPVKFDAEQRANIIFKDQVFKFNPQYKSNQLAVDLMGGKMSYPTTVYLDEKLELIQAVPGYLSAKDFDAVLHFFGKNEYRKQDWESFKKAYKSDL